MRKQILFAGALAMVSLLVDAKTKVYTMDNNLGEVNQISANGKWAAVSDTENNYAYLWSAETGDFTDISAPLGDTSVPAGQRVAGSQAIGVANDGTVVGFVLYGQVQKPAIYRNGKWELLPMHPAAMNTNAAISITGDGSIIGGFQFVSDKTSEIKGRFYPCRWIRNSGGEYDLECYTDIDLPDHQGFYPLTMTPDGKTLAGEVFCGVGSTVPGFVYEGELFLFNTFSTVVEPWIYKGKYYCGMEDGKQVWTEDPNDPRIVYYDYYFIDGVKDTNDDSSMFEGFFAGCDSEGNLYGRRTRAFDVDEEGNGTLERGACIYNINTSEWTDYPAQEYFNGGLNGGEYAFLSGDLMMMGDMEKEITKTFDFTTDYSIAGIGKYSLDGRVLGGMVYEVNPASGELQYYPLIVVLDEALVELVGVQDIVATDGTSGPVIVVYDNRIDICNANGAAVYDMDGLLVGTGDSVEVAPGIYVVVADGVSRKVIVK